MREEKQKQEEEEREAQKRAEEEERRREEEEEARRKAEEEEEERRKMEEEAKRRAEEEEARRIAEEVEAARRAQEEQKKREEAEDRPREPQTREDPDIELVTEETLDENLSVKETEEERGERDKEVNTITHKEEEQGKEEELEEEDLTNGTLAVAGPQQDEKEEDEDLKNETLEETSSQPALPSDVGTSQALRLTSPGEESNKAPFSNTSTPSTVEQKGAQPPSVSRGNSSRSQEKREQRRRRGLEHNQRETERASSSTASTKDQTPKSKSENQESSKLKERADSKELDQYTFVAWKMKEDKGGKKDAKASPSPVRPSTLSLLPTGSVPEKNGVSEVPGAPNLQRRPGAIKEKPEKWRGRRSDEEISENISPASSQHREDRRKKPLYVLFSVWSF